MKLKNIKFMELAKENRENQKVGIHHGKKKYTRWITQRAFRI